MKAGTVKWFNVAERFDVDGYHFPRPATDPTNLAGLVRTPGRHEAEPTRVTVLTEAFVEEHGQRRAPGRHVAGGRVA